MLLKTEDYYVLPLTRANNEVISFLNLEIQGLMPCIFERHPVAENDKVNLTLAANRVNRVL